MTAGRKNNTSNKEWGTPPKYVNPIKQFFNGTILLDPCSNKYSIVNAKTEYKLPRNDGLKKNWNFSTIYVNPPYGRDKNRHTSIKDWLRKCVIAHEQFKSSIIALIPVAPNTSHWKEYIFGKATAICFLYDTRLKFLKNGKKEGSGSPMACALIYWGKDFPKFYSIFKQFGSVVDITNLKK
jgi:hypothetical protein